MTVTTLVRGRWVVTGPEADDRLLSDHAVAVDDQGRIAAVDAWAALRAAHPDAEVIGGAALAVIPGLINAHHHSGGATALQHGLPDLLLEPWILAHAALRPADSYLTTLVSAARLLRSGVTSVIDVRSGQGRADAYAQRMRDGLRAHAEAGLRVAFAIGLGNQSHLAAGRGEDARFLAALPAEARAAAESLLPRPDDISIDDYFAIVEEAWHAYRAHPRVDVWYAPPGPQWVSDDVLVRIGAAAEAHDVGIQTHVTESIYEKLHGPRDYGKATVAHLRDLGILGPRFSIAHGVWLTEAEIAILAETGTAVVHNPSSNLRLRAGIAPLNALRAAGVTLALGMDGTTLNDDEDMFTEMRLALRLHRTPQLATPAPSRADIAAMATTGGAKLLRQEEMLGRIAPGYRADLALLRLDRMTWPWVAPEVDIRDLILMRARAGDVETVLIDGEVVLRDGRPTRFDLEDAAAALAEQLDREPYPDAAAAAVATLQPHLERYYRDWDVPPLDPYIRYNSKR